jgi:hypothetical protein
LSRLPATSPDCVPGRRGQPGAPTQASAHCLCCAPAARVPGWAGGNKAPFIPGDGDGSAPGLHPGSGPRAQGRDSGRGHAGDPAAFSAGCTMTIGSKWLSLLPGTGRHWAFSRGNPQCPHGWWGERARVDFHCPLPPRPGSLGPEPPSCERTLFLWGLSRPQKGHFLTLCLFHPAQALSSCCDLGPSRHCHCKAEESLLQVSAGDRDFTAKASFSSPTSLLKGRSKENRVHLGIGRFLALSLWPQHPTPARHNQREQPKSPPPFPPPTPHTLTHSRNGLHTHIPLPWINWDGRIKEHQTQRGLALIY